MKREPWDDSTSYGDYLNPKMTKGQRFRANQRQRAATRAAYATTGRIIAFFISFIMFTFITILGFVILATIFVLVYLIKLVYRIIYRVSTKKKIKIFILDSFDNKIWGMIEGLFHKWSRLNHDSNRMMEECEKEDYKNHPLNKPNKHARLCELCGGRLGRGRIRYCSVCRPTGRATPYLDEEY